MKNLGKASIIQLLQDARVREKLQAIEKDTSLHKIKTTYSANTDLYPDNQMPFVDKHYDYLLKHPDVDPDQYLANLRLMLKR